YMNTGIQRSSATPKGASATTPPVGKVKQGKEQPKKDLTAIIAAHNVPYAAQAIIGDFNDYITKVQKALNTDGPTFINVLTPCRLGWGCKPEDSMEMVRLAVDTCIWPVYEVVNGKYKMTKKPRGGKKLPVGEFFKHQSRFKHLLKPQNAELLANIQADVDAKWEKICNLCGEEVIK
ncbi:MAG: pyruvate ferredoxin oxidoreductase, partial [Elusimicrobia bacterium]|nr:pyruvate ferredoxin oxidoreductase [Elusimicrobiota bacterium]